MKLDANDIASTEGVEGLKRAVEERTAKAVPATYADLWPEPLTEEAYHGLIGQIVRTIEPHTEADPAALLIQLLAAIGNAIGRKAYWRVGGSKHYSNLFAVLVGKSSRGRKGTAKDEVLRLFEDVDDDWTKRVKGGLSSGEGLVHQVRDPLERIEDGEPVIVDAGAEDKRLLIVEPEFAQVLKQSERQGNILSPLIRQAWDSGNLETLTRKDPMKATGAHVSIIGHITQHELRRCLNSTEAANGFANRFAWVAVKRARELPFGGALSDMDLAVMRGELAKVLAFASNEREYRRAKDADQIWPAIYHELEQERDGLAASVCGRASAQVMRMSMIYAIADCAEEITRKHLEAGLAVWRYCEDSAKAIFGTSFGDPVADEIQAGLRECADGLTRGEIYDLLGRNRSKAAIEGALEMLKRNGVATVTVNIQGKGRPVERWKFSPQGTR